MKRLCLFYAIRNLCISVPNLGKNMACSHFEYVKKFEIPDPCLLNCWPIVRIDGKNFHKFSTAHGFKKPNDERALKLMNKAAEKVMDCFADIIISYGQSDEYSFVFNKSTETYNRRASKLSSVVVSQFASSYVFYWNKYFCDQELIYPPAFDSRVVLYPSEKNLKDYLSWRQVDCHINNLYNTSFWSLVHSGMTNNEAQLKLKGTSSGDKNEILFSQFNINYNNLPQLYRKGTVIIRDKSDSDSVAEPRESSSKVSNSAKRKKTNKNNRTLAVNVDIIGKEFWEKYPHILSG